MTSTERENFPEQRSNISEKGTLHLIYRKSSLTQPTLRSLSFSEFSASSWSLSLFYLARKLPLQPDDETSRLSQSSGHHDGIRILLEPISPNRPSTLCLFFSQVLSMELNRQIICRVFIKTHNPSFLRKLNCSFFLRSNRRCPEVLPRVHSTPRLRSRLPFLQTFREYTRSKSGSINDAIRLRRLF